MKGSLLAVLVLVSVTFAGCLGTSAPSDGLADPAAGNRTTNATPPADDDGTEEDPSGNQTDEGSDDDPDPGNETGGNGTDEDASGNQTSGNGTEGNATDPGWPDPGSAPIRPGATIAGQSCTASFVFSDPSNATLYIGTASHCVSGKSIGDSVEVGNVNGAGVLVYCSWGTIAGQAECPEESTTGSDPANDFALVEIKDQHRDKVHPSMLGYGGPTALGADPGTGDHVLTYGNTNLRPGSTADGREGYVETTSAWIVYVQFLPSSLPGDSGSPVIADDGSALGVLSTLVIAPYTGANGVVRVDKAVGFMEDKTDLEVELKTWSLGDSGLLP